MKKTLVILISVYKMTLSKILSILFGGGCRFTPSCGEYARGAIEKYGIVKGTRLTVIRLSKCQPFSKSFGWDPVK